MTLPHCLLPQLIPSVIYSSLVFLSDSNKMIQMLPSEFLHLSEKGYEGIPGKMLCLQRLTGRLACSDMDRMECLRQETEHFTELNTHDLFLPTGPTEHPVTNK